LGFLLAPVQLQPYELLAKPWALSAVIIGSVFIGMFYIMALSSQKVGVAVSSVANKMSLVIPVIAGFLLYQESAPILKIIGIILAITSLF